MKEHRRRVAVIGAGPSGLCTLKELVQEGHDAVCLERGEGLGGLFRFNPDPRSIGVWRTCRLTSSPLVTSFSDFPPWGPDDDPAHRHWSHSEYVGYLDRYVAQFALGERIRFGCEVRQLDRLADGQWRLFFDEQGSEKSLEVDAVAICTGLHSKPHIPGLKGLSEFRGEVLHSAHYKDQSDIKGKTAVFVGCGESGSEIIEELSRSMSRSYVSLRRGTVVIPRLLNGLPNDYTGTRLIYSLPEIAIRRSDERASGTLRRICRLLFPLVAVRAGLLWVQRRQRRRRNDSMLLNQQAGVWDRLPRKSAARVFSERRRRNDAIEAVMIKLRREARSNQFESFATKSEGFVRAIVDGRAELRPAIDRVLPNGVQFEDGSRVEADALIFSTGFEPAFVPFLVIEVDLGALYLNCFAPDVGETLAFIGFIRPPLGAIPPMAEMQARLFSQVVGGKRILPSAADMKRDVVRRLAKRRAYFREVFGRLPQLADYSAYMDELAEIIGCKPRLADLMLRPRLIFKIYTGPFCSAQYRLRGPHSDPRRAGRLIESVPSQFMLVRFADLAFSHLASLCGIRNFRPRLSLLATVDADAFLVE